MSTHLIHDNAWATAMHLVERLACPCLKEAPAKNLFHQVYLIVKSGLEAYDEFKRREAARLDPSQN